MGKSWRSTGIQRMVAIVGFLASALALVAEPAPPAIAEDGIELSFLTGTYRDLASNLEPIEQNGLRVQVSSPQHRLTVHRNRFGLSDAGGGRANATIEVDLDGEGLLVARLESAGIGTDFDDQVVLPRQTLRLAGRIKIERTAEELLFTVLEAPPEVRLEIESGLAAQLVGTCELFGKLLPVDCGALRLSLSRVDVPLPQAGEQFRLPVNRLSAAELAYFERFATVASPQPSQDRP